MMYFRIFGYLILLSFLYFFRQDWVLLLTIVVLIALFDFIVSNLKAGAVFFTILSFLVFSIILLVLKSFGLIPQDFIPFVLTAVVFLSFITGFRLGNSERFLFFDADLPEYRGCVRILDASALMDGRIYQVIETGFLDGTVMVPRFVIHQIEKIYKTGSDLKKQRAKMALELVDRLKNFKNIKFVLCELDLAKERDIDHKLIALAKKFKAKVVTNDYSLNRIASINDISVLNINDLANALKPMALPGEIIRITPIKKGKEEGQAVGYLVDGTMVVVNDGEDSIGHEVDVFITNVLQSSAGKIIFGNKKTLQ
ncbi:conserved hypothetical protein [Thermotomaculum hydrothermale]|uniref:TRAM domain-containing protein n=1 Tax=Thermotomaculum hydrothermale TaxID=981385 RepID=A0A7R6PE88_9BACT|nr:hypothetical protein [Thermotomaculum hydrothermale]BBB32088.1 conserved hypothetical protein [Thermotomaculum hydrothermale]